MNSIVKIALGATLLLSLGATTASADIGKGQKYYGKKLKKSCDSMSGAAFAAKHTLAEWEAIGLDGLAAEIKSICPKAKDSALKDKYTQHYFDFVKEYGSDTGNIPAC
ncbi:cytochrome C [Sulfurimonas sp. SAG-AH-194-I05]|nr:cytochrome C [Sulfurimonas sp. SAG-AH-194-I05]MDF1875275.1 cytochrome C [Sulfurimonas sp. SAG-AH-194-I05]